MLRLNNPRDQLDFDLWLKLAEEDPEAFEVERKAYIDAYIAESSSATARDRLGRMQWRIDQERDLAANPMDACIKLNSMMWNAFAGDKGLAYTLNHLSCNPFADLRHANVVKFRPIH